jgi:uncharacterized membrane protein
MEGLAIARALHVLGVIIWIGGVSMVTTVGLPAIRRRKLGQDPREAFHAIESRFVWQARGAVIVVGLSGLYMLWRLDLWGRFAFAQFWWMHAMVCLWILFALVLFLAEPLVVHRRFERWAEVQPDRAFAWLHGAHWVLLVLSLITVFGAVVGSHGWPIF